MFEISVGLGGVLAFALGASVGSFVNVVAYRLPREISIVRPRSFCPSCKRPIPSWANIPIVAYVALRGRCIMCGAAIPFRYFLAEAALACAALYLYLNFPLWNALARFVLCAALFAAALVDYDWRLIPNIITIPGMPIGFLAASLAITEVGWKSSLLGIALGAGLLFVTGEIYRLVRRREGVGLGDVWLLGMIGGFLGWAGVLFTLFFGSVLGSVGGLSVALMKPRPQASTAEAAAGGELEQADTSVLTTAVPFGPFLALAAGTFALFQPRLIDWYFGGR